MHPRMILDTLRPEFPRLTGRNQLVKQVYTAADDKESAHTVGHLVVSNHRA